MSFLSLRNGYHGLVGYAASVNLEGLKKDAMEIINSNCSAKIAGILFEPIQGIGDMNTFVDGYIPMITELVRSHGDLLSLMKGRVGTKYWGHKYYGFKPDIVTMAKTNGLPLAAVATRR